MKRPTDTFDVAAPFGVPAAEAWQALTDPSLWPRWGPSVREVQVDGPLGPGSRGRVRTALGVWVPFEITRWDPGRAWGWRVAGIPVTGHRVEPLGAHRCRVVFEVPYWMAPYAGVCRLAVRRLGRVLGAAPEPG